MPIDRRIRQCDQLNAFGERCGSPAMRSAQKCYYHLRPPKIDDFRISSTADPVARQKALTEIFNAVLANKMSVKRANSLLFAMQIAMQK